MGDKLLFLSHAGVDSAAALALTERIEASPAARERGLKVWIDKRDLKAGQPWLDQLEEVIAERSTAFAVYLGSGATKWVPVEVRSALSRAVERKNYPFIPIFSGSADATHLPEFARQYQGVRDVEQNTAEFQKLVAAALGEVQDKRLELVAEPFLGLRAYEEDQSFLFFGRTEETKDIIQRLTKTNLLLVVGDSGSGKSSLVKAGLIPAFRQGAFGRYGKDTADDTPWHVVQMRPSGNPFEKLVDAVSEAARSTAVPGGRLGQLYDWIRTKRPEKIRDALRDGAPPKAKTLLVVDQFEELWPQSAGCTPAEFIDAVLALATPGDDTHRVVLTMRRDYYNLCSVHSAFFERINARNALERYQVRRMSDEALRECIVKPLALTNAEDVEVFADAVEVFADAVLRDVGDQPGDLALMEMALTEAWRHSRKAGGSLLESYERRGRVSGALANAAEDVFGKQLVDDDERRRAEAIFMRLVRLGDTGGTTRRVAAKTEFRDDSWKLAQRLAREDHKRLLFVGADTAEIAHEALVTQWPRYQSWLQQAAADKRKLDALMDDAKRWAAAPKAFATGYDLENGLSLLNDPARKSWLSDTEIAFVEASDAERKREENEREETRKERERLLREQAEAAETSRRKIRRWLVATSVVALIATAASGIAVYSLDQLNVTVRELGVSREAAVSAASEAQKQRENALIAASEAQKQRENALIAADEAQRQREIATTRRLAAEARRFSGRTGNPNWTERGAALAVEALTRGAKQANLWSPDADAAARSLYARLPSIRLPSTLSIQDMAWSRDAGWLALRGAEGEVELWSIGDSEPAVSLPSGACATAMEWDPDGDRLACGDESGGVTLWANDGSAEPLPVEPGPAMVSVAWVKDGQELAGIRADGRISLWSMEASAGPRTVDLPAQPELYSWSARGDHLAVAVADDTIWVWDFNEAPEKVAERKDAASLSWEPQSDVLWIVTTDGVVEHRPDDRWLPWSAEGEDSARSVKWSPAGGLLLVEDAFGGFDLTDIDHNQYPLRSLSPSENTQLAWSPTGSIVAYGGDDDIVEIWHPAMDATGDKTRLTFEVGPYLAAWTLSSSGTLLAAAGNGGVRIWNIDENDHVVLNKGRRISWVTWSPQSRRLLTRDELGDFDYWSASGEGPARLPDHDYHRDAKMTAVAWSPKGTRLATANERGEIIVRELVQDLGQGQSSRPVRHGSHVAKLSWSPRGDRLASAGGDVVDLWSWDNPHAPTPREAPVPLDVRGVADLAWSREGDRLATLTSVGLIQIWQPDKGIADPPIGAQVRWQVRWAPLGNAGNYLSWSPSGRWVLLHYPDEDSSMAAVVSAESEGDPVPIGGGPIAVAWSPLEDRIAVSGSDGTVRLWAPTGQSESPQLEHGAPVRALAWSPDGGILATGSEGIVRLWALDAPVEPVELNVGAAVLWIGWSLDGDRLAARSSDGVVQVWIVDPKEIAQLLCSRAGRNLSDTEWATYIGPDEPWQPTCETW